MSSPTSAIEQHGPADPIASATRGAARAQPRARRRDRCDRAFAERRMPAVWYAIGKALGRFVWLNTIRAKVIRPELADREGGFLLACTHLSHLEPFLLSIAVRRRLDWMTRVEFYASRICALLLRRLDAFPVRRFGVPVSAVRTSIARLRRGRAIGICPEGGVAVSDKSVIRGGPIKRGVCLIAMRAGVPIVPVVMLGTHDLNRVGPWLPFKRARLWMAFGEPVFPPTNVTDRRAARDEMAGQLRRSYAALYDELRERYGIRDEDVP